MTANQIEFPLAVAVCAWCKPRSRGASSVFESHGICPRHLRSLKSEIMGSQTTRTKTALKGGAARFTAMFLPL